jgi:hypothetical protein
MTNVEKIHELAEELAKLFKEEFPKASTCKVRIEDGKIYTEADCWVKPEDGDYSHALRRAYMNDKKEANGKWDIGNVEYWNNYYERCGVLKKEGD